MYRLLIGILLVFSVNGTVLADAKNTLARELNVLAHAKLSQMPEQISVLAKMDDSRVPDILQALLDGKLYFRKTDKKIFLGVAGPDRTLELSDPLKVLGATNGPSKEYKRIGVNNRMRSQLRKAISHLRLQSSDEEQRLAAVLRILNDLNPEVVVLLNQLAETETNKDILEAVYVGRALVALEHGDRLGKLAAIDLLAGSLQPVALNKLQLIVESDANGQRLEADPVIFKRAEMAIAKIEGKANFYGFVETTFFGLSLGSVLLLSAVGLAITFGVMGVINMAHGELIMLGAYTTYVVQLLMPNHLEYSLLVAVPTAFVVSGLVGVAIERGIIRFLYGRPLETLLATFGVSLVLQQAVRSIFSPLNRSVSTPEWMSGSWQINPLFSLTYNRMYILVFAIIVFVLLLLLLKKTTLGLQFRAVAQNRAMARAMGIRSQWVDAMTFGLGSGVAGIAGVALSQLTNVGPNLGQAYIIDSFMVVVFGGVGNLWGTLVSAFSLGIANKFIEPVAGAVLAKILVLVFIILFIQRNPRGLFPQQGRAVD